jgi:hypothetical protein
LLNVKLLVQHVTGRLLKVKETSRRVRPEHVSRRPNCMLLDDDDDDDVIP